jgi:serine/threonine-protein kinase
MNEARWRVVERLFHEALALPPEEHPRFLAERIPDDPALLAEVRALLMADADPAALFEATPELLASAAGLAATSLPTDHPTGAPPFEPEPLTGRTIGPYRILEPIGRGGMGIVYRAVRDDLGNQVALKVVRGALGDPVRLARFRQEQRVLARLEHERIARLLDAGVAGDETPYLVMEYVEGEAVTTWCDARGLGVAERLRLVLEICDAVAFAHRNLVVHRDLKPSNVLVAADGHVKLLDFGVAKLLEGADDGPELTATGVRILSPEYAAPEQILGQAVTTATDIYGLGLLLYELLTSQRYQAGARDLTGTLTGDLHAICLCALERDPARRYASVELLHDDIARHLAGLPVRARLPTLTYRMGKFVRRHAVGVAAAAALALLLAAGVGTILWQAGAALRARAEAEALSGFLVDVFEASDPMEARGERVTARDLLERGAIRADRLGDRPDVQARLLDAMARAYLGLGDYPRADSLAEHALARELALHGERHADVAQSLVTLGRVRRGQGRYAEAVALFREALALRRDLLGDRHDLTTGAMIELAGAIQESGGYDEAEALAREALASRTAAHGSEHEGVAEATAWLGQILWASGRDLPRAEVLFREALALRERLWGDDDPRLEASLTPLSAFLPFVQKAPEAESLARRALEIRRRVYGEDHPMVAHQLNNVARAIEAQGRLPEARALYHEMLHRYQSSFTGDHHLATIALNNVSATFYAEGALDSAEHYLRQSLEMSIRLYGAPDANVALRYHNLGSLLRAQGRLAEAETALEEAYHQRNEIYGAENPIALRTGAAYANTLVAQGKLAVAEPLLRQILTRQQRPGDDDISADAARTMGYLARLLTLRGAFAEAEDLYRPALEIARTRLPPTHPRPPELVAGLIDLYNAWNRPADAEHLRQEEQEEAR